MKKRNILLILFLGFSLSLFGGCKLGNDFRYVTKVAAETFYNCSSLEWVNLWAVETIGAYAFYNCSKLAYSGYGFVKFHIPTTVTAIGNNAFEGCTSLTEISIQSSIVANFTTNDSYLFRYANLINILKEITIESTSFLDDSQGHFSRNITNPQSTYDELHRIE